MKEREKKNKMKKKIKIFDSFFYYIFYVIKIIFAFHETNLSLYHAIFKFENTLYDHITALFLLSFIYFVYKIEKFVIIIK